MSGSRAQAGSPRQPFAPPDAGRHLLLYDGSCGLCHGIVRAVLALDRVGIFHFARLQSTAASQHLARFGGVPSLDSFVVIVDYRSPAGVCLIKGRAALFAFAGLGWPWKAAEILRLLPPAMLDAAYDVIARNRYHLFGRRDRCMVPRAEYQRRFVDGTGGVSRDEARA